MQIQTRGLVAALALAGTLVPATSAARYDAAPRLGRPAQQHRAGCAKLYTVRMAERAALRVYGGRQRPSRRSLRALGRFRRCQRRKAARGYVRWLYGRERRRRAERIRAARDRPSGTWLASWYDDSGSTASGFHARYGIALCGSAGPCYPFGTRVELWYGGRSIEAVVDDHGPYAGGRNVDLGASTAQALGFSGVGGVGYRIL